MGIFARSRQLGRRLAAVSRIGLLVFSVCPGMALATPINITLAEDVNSFNLTVTGGDFDSDDSHPISVGTDWDIDLLITEDSGVINDILKISGLGGAEFGTARHENAHIEAANTASLEFKFLINADDFAEGVDHKAGPTGGTFFVSHPTLGHTDVMITAVVTFDTTSTLGIDDITKWELRLSGVHCVASPSTCEAAAVPEPNTGLLVGIGLAGLAFRKSLAPRGTTPVR